MTVLHTNGRAGSRLARSTALPHDPAAEAALVAGALAHPDHVEAVAADLSAADFADSGRGAVWATIVDLLADGVVPDRVTVADRLRRQGVDVDLSSLVDSARPPQRAHVEIVLGHAAARRALGVLGSAAAELGDGADPFDVVTRTARDLDRVAAGDGGGVPEAMPIAELVASADAETSWLVPGLATRDSRTVVTAPEGCGKSTLLRQIAVCTSQGLDPFCRFVPIDPLVVLVVDAENPRAVIADTGGWLNEQARRTAGADYDPFRCKVWSRPGGLDLREPGDRADLVRELRAARPDLVVAGPVYKLGGRRAGESYETAAEGTLAVLDDLRTRFSFSLLLEHHSAKAQGSSARPLAPFGSQRWMAWPEVGIGLRPDPEDPGRLLVSRFRGDRLPVSWPDAFDRAEAWPWVGTWLGSDPPVVPTLVRGSRRLLAEDF